MPDAYGDNDAMMSITLRFNAAPLSLRSRRFNPLQRHYRHSPPPVDESSTACFRQFATHYGYRFMVNNLPRMRITNNRSAARAPPLLPQFAT